MPDNISYREFILQRRNNRFLLTVNGTYYLLTGLWPIVHITSFMQVSGFKTDLWLVKTVGALILCIGLTQLRERISGKFSATVAFLSVISATALLAIDAYYGLNSQISSVYLIDGMIQLLLAGSWLLFLIRTRKTST
jgi:hypothetical protein